MKVHELKCWPEFFNAIIEGRKTFEIRKNDRDYQPGDCLVLKEWQPNVTGTAALDGEYTGRETRQMVPYVTTWAQIPGHVVMSLKPSLRPSGDNSR